MLFILTNPSILRRKISKFWNIGAMPPLIESQKDVVYVDEIIPWKKSM